MKPMPRPLYDSEAIEVNGMIFVAGGYDATGKCSKAIFSYSYDSISWTAKTYLNGEIDKVVLAKSNMLLYVFVKNTLHAYDTFTDTWLEVFRMIEYLEQR